MAAAAKLELARPAADAFVIPDRKAFLETLDLSLPALARVKAALDAGDVDGAGRAFARHFRTRPIETPLLPNWDVIPRDATYADPVAEDCLRGRIYDGYNHYDVPAAGIDWHDCPLFCLPRFPIVAPLVKSWHHTQDPRYLRFVIDHAAEYMAAYPIADFAGKHSNEGYRNHYLVGPPTWWCLCPQRIEQWAAALTTFRHSPLVTDDEILDGLHRMLQEVRWFVTQIPYWLGIRHNSAAYTIRAMGIYARVFADFTEAAEWRRKDAAWLAEYIDKGFYPDGLYKELALGYSSSSASQVAIIAAELFDEPVIQACAPRLESIMEAIVGISRPDGMVPSFGDGNCQRIDQRWQPTLADRLKRPWMQQVTDRFANPFADPLPALSTKPVMSQAFAGYGDAAPAFTAWPKPGEPAWGGYYAMRNHWGPDACYMMIDGGPWGTTHQHMDKLSFELAAYGANFITDPGNTKYASTEPDARITMLNAGFMHNGITVDGVDEYVRHPSEWSTKTPLTNRWEHGDNYVLFEGEYDFQPDVNVLWRRRVLYMFGRCWLMQDVLVRTDAGDSAAESASSLRVEQNFQFERGIDVSLSGGNGNDDGSVAGGEVVATAGNGAKLLLMSLGGDDDVGGRLDAAVMIGEETSHDTRSTQYSVSSGPKPFGHGRGWVSRVTHKPDPAPALVRSGQIMLPSMITLALCPLAPGQGRDVLPRIEALPSSDTGEAAWRVSTSDGALTWRTSVGHCEVQLG